MTTAVPYRGVQRHVVTPERHSVSLPPDTIAEGVRRLGRLALVYAIGYITGPFARLVLSAVAGRVDSSDFGIPDVFGLGAVIMALGVLRRCVEAPCRRGACSISAWCSRSSVRWASPAASSGRDCRQRSAVRSYFRANACGSSPIRSSCRTLRGRFWSRHYSRHLWVRRHSRYPQSQLRRGRPLDAATYFLTSSYLCAVLSTAACVLWRAPRT